MEGYGESLATDSSLQFPEGQIYDDVNVLASLLDSLLREEIKGDPASVSRAISGERRKSANFHTVLFAQMHIAAVLYPSPTPKSSPPSPPINGARF